MQAWSTESPFQAVHTGQIRWRLVTHFQSRFKLILRKLSTLVAELLAMRRLGCTRKPEVGLRFVGRQSQIDVDNVFFFVASVMACYRTRRRVSASGTASCRMFHLSHKATKTNPCVRFSTASWRRIRANHM